MFLDRLNDWDGFAHKVRGTDVLVVGNGPSLHRDAAMLPRFEGVVIACNSYWRNELRWRNYRRPDYLVCYDVDQAVLALHSTNEIVVVPDICIAGPHRRHANDTSIPEELLCANRQRIVVITPFLGGFPDKGDTLNLTEGAWGNLSGYLAFQFAWRMWVRKIYLLGMDVSGVRDGDGRVTISASDSSWEGYGHARLAPRHCVDVEGRGPDSDWQMPRGWVQKQRFWKDLTDRVTTLGVEVRRASDSGALHWIPVEPWCDHSDADHGVQSNG